MAQTCAALHTCAGVRPTRKPAGAAKHGYRGAAEVQPPQALSRRAAGPSGSASRGPEDDGRRDQVSRYTSRHDSGEACHLPSHSFGSAPHNMSICAPGCQIQLLWLGGRRTLSPTHQNRSRLSWHESRNACEGMRRRGEHSAHTLHRTRARRPPEANFRARRWLWTAPHDDAPSE